MAVNGKFLPKQVSANDKIACGPYPLSKEQCDFYWANGYLIVKNLYDVQTLNVFRNRFIDICNNKDLAKFYSIVKDPERFKVNTAPEKYINKIQELLYDEIFMKYSEDPKTLHILSQLIGENLTALNCMLINKPPGTCDHLPHQDLYFIPIRPADKIVGVWTAIDQVYPDNGCLYVIPGSHKIDSLYHHEESASEKKQFFFGIRHLPAAAAEKRVHLSMAPGDTVFLHPYLVHGSGTNISKECRKALTSHYANSACHYIDVKGTTQEPLAIDVEREAKRRGANVNFVDLFMIKCKLVKGIRSHL